MGAYAPTCSKCGAILIGYGWSDELDFLVHFCTQCKAKEASASGEVKKQAVEMAVLDEAA